MADTAVAKHWRWRRDSARDMAVQWFSAGLAAADPAGAVRRALAERRADGGFTHLIAAGKGAVAMARAADEWREAQSGSWSGAVVVPPAGPHDLPTRLPVVPGDHPVPGAASSCAAEAIGQVVSELSPRDGLLLLLSGGATSLMAAPVAGLATDGLRRVFADVLASGLDIHAANLIRKRFLRWGGGRLAAALGNAPCLTLAISDVTADRPESIGSGPVSPDPTTAADVTRLASDAGIELPDDARALLDQAVTHARFETPKPGDPCFRRITYEVIASNHDAIMAVERAAAGAGWEVTADAPPLCGEASAAGAAIGRTLLAMRDGRRRVLVLGGETTVTIRGRAGTGGRSHELALAAARELAGVDRVLLLAAGTDGRDGATDDAGAIVDGASWSAMPDGVASLVRHDAGSALRRAGLALHTGLTGTNVMDLVIGLSW